MHFKALMTVAQSLDGEAGKKKRAKAFILTHCRVPTYQLQGCEAGGEIEDQSYHQKTCPGNDSVETESSNKAYQIWLIFRLGILSGMFFVLFTVLIIAAIKADNDIQWEPAFRMYRGLFLFILELFLFGINLYGWKSVGINPAHICDLKNRLCPLRALELSLFFAVLWGTSAVVFLFSDQFGLPHYAHPIALACFFLIFGFNTLNVCFRHARFWLLRALWRVLTAPFHPVAFADFWLADQLNSLVVAILDMEYMSCFYALDYYSVQDRNQCGSKLYGLRPLIACLPAWWRFAQSLRRYDDTKQKFPHLANAGKYATTFFVVFFSTVATTHKENTGKQQMDFYFLFWIFSAFVSTCYTYVWDVRMDWGLMDSNHGYLRAKLLFKHLEYEWVTANCQGNLMKCWGVTCDGLASHPGGVAIPLVTPWYRSRDKLRQLRDTVLLRLLYRVLNKRKRNFVRSNKILRGERERKMGFYYFALVANLFLRLSWVLTVSVGEAGLFHSEVLTALLAVLEVFRRFVWNFLRVENEHLSRLKGEVDHSQEELREYDEDEQSEEPEE